MRSYLVLTHKKYVFSPFCGRGWPLQQVRYGSGADGPAQGISRRRSLELSLVSVTLAAGSRL